MKIIIILEEYGVTLVDQNDQLTVDKLNWKGEAKKSGIQMGDIISNFKIENPERPNKAIVYPFALIFLFIFGYINFKFLKNLGKIISLFKIAYTITTTISSIIIFFFVLIMWLYLFF